MLKVYQKFLLKRYIKNFIVLFLALEFFFTGMDLMQNFKYLPNSANLQIVYTYNKFLAFINYTLPLSLVFAMISTIFNIIKSSELVALYSLGRSKKDIIKPIFFVSSFITLLYISLWFTDFSMANYKAENIKKYGTISTTTSDLFLKSKNNYISIKRLNPIKKEANGIKIFATKDGKLQKIIKSPKAKFNSNSWNLEDVKIIDIKRDKLDIKKMNSLRTLKDFKPEVMDNLYKGKGGLTIIDSILAINLLKKEHIDSKRVLAHLYNIVIFPLFAPIVILLLFYPLPLQRRGTNIALLSSIYIFSTMLIWGVIFTMSRIAQNGAISPFMGIVFPIILLLLATIYIVFKHK